MKAAIGAFDAVRGDRKITIEWRPKQGFGVSFGAGGYGEGPEFVLTSVDDAADRIFRFLQSANEPDSSDRTVLLASEDFSWRSAITEQLKTHHVWADAVSSLAEAANSLAKETHLVVVIDVPTETPHGFAAWRKVLKYSQVSDRHRCHVRSRTVIRRLHRARDAQKNWA